MTIVLVVVIAGVVVQIRGIFRWVVAGVLAYGLLSLPWILSLALRMRWNAPEAERRNRELLASTAEG